MYIFVESRGQYSCKSQTLLKTRKISLSSKLVCSGIKEIMIQWGIFQKQQFGKFDQQEIIKEFAIASFQYLYF